VAKLVARRPDKSASAFDKFPWVTEGKGGQAKATTLLGFVKDLFRQGGVVCAGLVKDSEESPIMKNFLDHLVKVRLEKLGACVQKIGPISYLNEKYEARDFSFLEFGRNMTRIKIMLGTFDPTVLSPTDLSKVQAYKILLGSGWEIVRKSTGRFLEQLGSWMARLMIFFLTFNLGELGERQQFPTGPGGRHGTEGSVPVRARQARHHFFISKKDFLLGKSITDVEMGTPSFSVSPPKDVPPEYSHCIVKEDWRGAVLQEQTLVSREDGVLEWKDSYAGTESLEVVKLLKTCFWDFMCSPMGEEEREGVWRSYKTSEDFRPGEEGESEQLFQERWEGLPDFLLRSGITGRDFSLEGQCLFGAPVPGTQFMRTGADKTLDRCDEVMGLDFKEPMEKMRVSGAIRRWVWPLKVVSRHPRKSFGLTGTFEVRCPLMEEWDYRLVLFFRMGVLTYMC
jgi:hypothetical protein